MTTLAPAERACHAVPAPVVAALQAGLTVSGARLRGAQMIRSDQEPGWGYVAADVPGPDWPSGRRSADWRVREPGGSIFAVGDPAVRLSRFPSGGDPRLGDAATACVRARLATVVGVVTAAATPVK